MQRTRSLLFTACFLLFSTLAAHAQLTVTGGITAAQLINNISGNGVIISNVTINCDPLSYGLFDGTNSNIGMTNGVLLTTGDINNAIGPNISGSTGYCVGTSYSDPDLVAIEASANNDACIIEFDIIPQCDTLSMSYVFGSDEYPEFVNSVNDAFGFFVSGPNPLGGNYTNQNIALIPGTNNAVTINTVNNITNSAYYVDNTGGTTIEYDGFTVPLTATIPVVQCQTYHMKLAIADASDCIYDSGVFLTYQGLNCPNNDVVAQAIIDTAQEGCQPAQIQLNRTNTSGTLQVSVTTGGTAIQGTDYTINNTYTFGNGQGTLNINVPALNDGLTEGAEDAQIVFSWLVCGVAVTDTVNLVIIDEPLITFVSNPENCGNCDGDATATIAGGVGPFTYLWSPNPGGGQATNSVTGLCAQTYTLDVTDANGCTATNTVTIASVGGPTLNVNTVDETCLGDNDGSITATASGGSGTYTYNIGGANQASGTFTGLAPNTYTVTVTDNSGCTATQTVTINPGPVCCSLVPTAVSTNVICNGASDGTGTATPTGSVGAVTYDWQDGGNNTVSTTNPATGLGPGTYTVYVTDANCTVTAQITITEPPAVTIATAFTDPICNGATDGTITITGGGGMPPLQYSIDNGGTFQGTGNFTNLGAGVYNCVVEDANGCQATAQVTLTDPPAVVYSVTTSNILCNGDLTGQVDVSASSGGTGGLTFSDDNGITFQGSGNFTGLGAGSYDMIVVDANGCQVTSTEVITEPAAVTLATAFTDPLCAGTPDGTITLTGAGGVGSFVYSIDNGVTFGASGSFTGLGPGTYDCIVEDANGCQATAQIVITDPPAVTIATVFLDPVCNGANDGSITITGGGGTGALNYSIDNGTTFQTTGVFAGLGGGVFDCIVEDANGCQATAQVTLVEPIAVTFTSVVVDATCGNADGSITLTGNGGTGILNYSIDNGVTFQASGSFTTLNSNTYDIIVEDANGCQATGQLTVVDLGGPSIDATAFTDPSCAGVLDGTITITASGGNGGIQYSIDNGVTFQGTGNFTGLGGGVYDILIQDGNGCQVTAQITLTNPPGVTLATSTLDILCNGDLTGEIYLLGSGGNGTYQYSIDNGGTFQASGTFTGLGAGIYDCIVEDGNGCQASAQITLTEPTALTVSITVVQPSCSNLCDATGTTVVSGGVPPYTYVWTDGTTAPSLQAACGGVTYTVVVTDFNGCTVTQSFTPVAPPAITFTTTIADATCGNADGSITVNAAGGSNGLIYSNDNGLTFQNSNVFNALLAGTYDIVVQDGNGCDTTAAITVSNLGAPSIDNLTFTDPLCNGASDGTIDITASGGMGALTYSSDNGVTFQPSNSFTGMPAGVYTIVVQDANGCQTSQNVTLTDPTAVSYTEVLSDLVCNGDNSGQIDITGAGGTGALQYSIDNGGTFQISGTFAGLAAGTYDIVVEDGNGCQATGQVVLTEPTAVTLVTAFTDPLCAGALDGTIDLTGGGGTGTLNYSVDNGLTFQVSPNFTGLGAGIYDCIVEDANGCQAAGQVTLTDPAGMTLDAVNTTDVTCFGLGDGTIDITVSGGSGMGYMYSIDNGLNFQASNSFTNVSAGNYNLVITDGNGCQITGTAAVNEPAPVQITANGTTTICIGASTPIDGQATGGTGTYTYTWDNGLGNGQNQNVSPGSTTVYNVFATDGNGCVSSTAAVVVTLAPPLSVTALSDQDICAGSQVSLSAIAQGGNGAYTYSWDDGNGNVIAGQSISPSPTITTIYTVTVTDGCGTPAASDQVTITVNPDPVVTFSADTLFGCEPLTVTFTNLTDANLQGSCLWDFGDGTFDANCGPVTHTYLVPGLYTVTLTVTSPAGCVGTLTQTNLINVYGYPTAAFDWMPLEPTILDAEVQFINNSTDATDYFWDFGGMGTADNTNPIFDFNSDEADSYNICLTASNDQGCVDMTCHTIVVLGEFTFYAPNAFTPDNDGMNDFFYVEGLNFDNSDFGLFIYNRWGQLIHEAHDRSKAWDGTFKGEKVQEDVYVWKVVLKDNISGETKEYHGHVTVIR